ncbi:MAG TPA: hypothetical protein VK864_18295, partial [Longimicrobiales bacterium]|nr:hypothetical protein [Longimicrobiales bacterium]
MRVPRQRVVAVVLWAGPYSAIALLLAWARAAELNWLIAAVVITLACSAAFVTQRARLTARVPLQAALFFLVAGLIAASAVAWRLHALARDWDRLQTARQALTRQTLDRRMAVLLDQGRSAALAAARVAESPEEIFSQLDELQRRSNVDALAILGEDAVFRAWAGEHRGKVPDSVRTSQHSVWFQEGPLYSYLYFTAPLRTGGTALAAVLLDAALPEDESQPGVAAQIELLAARGASFLPGPGGLNDWHLVVDGDTLLHARLGAITQGEWRRDLLKLAQRTVIGAVVLALIFLSFGWFREETRPRPAAAAMPLAGTATAVFLAPFGSALGLESIFSPGLFLLPGPIDVPLGSLLVLLLVAALFASTVRVRARYRSGLWFIALALLLAIASAPAVQLLIGPSPRWERLRAPTSDLLQSNGALWAGLQFTLVLLLATANSFVLMLARWPGRITVTRRRSAAFLLIGGAAALAAVLAISALVWIRRHQTLSALYAQTWLLPLLLAGYGIALYQHEGRRILRWLTAGWLAATLVLPFVWSAHVSARLRYADRELQTLGSLNDPYLLHVLRQFGQEAIARRERGEDGLQLLYRTWVTSGLASEAVPARIMLWDAQRKPEIQLTFGTSSTSLTEPLETVPSYLASMFERVQELAHP